MDRDDVTLERDETLHRGFYRMARLHLRHRLFDGGTSPTVDREVVLHGRVAVIVPYDPVRDEVVLLEQFRVGKYAAGDPKPWSVSVAAGMIEDGESAADMARRETLEETGCTVGRLEEVLAFYASPGGSSQHVTLFCGEVSSEGIDGFYGVAEEGEDIRAFAVSANDAFAMIDTGEIDNAVSIVGLQWLWRNRDDVRRRWT